MTSATTNQQILDPFKTLVHEIQDLRSTQGLLGWDLETHMPPRGAEIRACQMSTLAKISHELFTSDRMGDYLSALSDASVFASLDPLDQALVREVAKDYARERKIPPRLVQEMTQVTTQAHPIWVEARQKSDYTIFSPVLSKIIDLNREMAQAIGYEGSPYNALLDLYEPGLTTDTVDSVFNALKPPLVALIQRVADAPAKTNRDFLHAFYDPEAQWNFSLVVLKAMGFDFEAGRQDKAAHPFTMGMGPYDVRLTTRIFPNDLPSCIFSTIHEGGHGLYEQGIDPRLMRTPLDGGASLGIHESQSRLWENLIGRSHEFWTYYLPQLKQLFPEALASVDAKTFYRAINQVTPSLIRVEADEVTYNLHILLRYEIEKALIENTLAVSDIPAAWNRAMQDYLGIVPPDDARGCLQDVHWSHGSFGYFPTYTLGNLYAAQLFDTALQQMPDLMQQIANGEFLALKGWLNEQVHRLSKVETPDQIITRVTGSPLRADFLVQYLQKKVAGIYDLPLQ